MKPLAWFFFLLSGLVPFACGLDREAFSVIHYDVTATVEPEQQRLGVRGTMILRNDSSSPQNNLALQISSTLGWRSIQLGGEPVQFFSQNYTSDIDHTGALTEAILSLPHPIAPMQTLELEIGYEGVVPQDATRLTRIGVPRDSADHSDWDRISRSFTAIRGIGYVTWYPVATEAASLSEGTAVFDAVERWKRRESGAEMQVKLCVLGTSPFPTALMNDSNSQSSADGADSTTPATATCSRHRYSYIGLTVPMFTVGNYSKLEQANLDIYYLPEHRAGADNYALAARETTPIVSEWFGSRDLSGQRAQVVDLADPDGSPFESGNLLLMPLVVDDATLLLSSVQHLTHAAFQSPRPWISEGLARYAQARYLAERKGYQAAIVYLENHRWALLEAEKQNAAAAGEERTDHSLLSAGDELAQQIKAMSVWWMLKDMVGEAALKAALHSYRAADDKDPNYMQKVIEAEAHRDLGWFFADWVYHDRGLPDLRIRSVYPRQTAEKSYMVTVSIENLGGAGAEVPVTVHMVAGNVSERLVVPAKSRATVRILAASPPRQVLVNDGSVPELKASTHEYRVRTVAVRK